MKNTVKRTAVLMLAVLMLLAMTACGKKQGNEFNSEYYNNPQNDQVLEEPTGTGFDHNHAVEAGFGMGSDTSGDIIGRFGQPQEQTINEYTSVTVESLTYPFGIFEFEGAPGTTPVLTYVQITAQHAAPCGIAFAENIESAANKVYASGGTGLMTSTENQKYFYGDGSANSEYGLYKMLTIEFIGTNTQDVYALEYRSPAYEQGKNTTFTLYFNGDFNMTWYSLRYE